MSVARYDLAAATIGNYAIFAGGLGEDSNHNHVDVFNNSLTKITSVNTLSVNMYDLTATTIGNYALFGGGSTSSTVINAYDSSLNRTTSMNLTNKVESAAAVTIGNYAIFAGGRSYASGYINHNTLDIFQEI